MRIFFQIIQTQKNQRVPTILVNVDNQKFFFNIAEPFHRFLKDHGVKFSQGQKFFFTRISSDNVSGVFPIMTDLFKQNSSIENQFYGPKNFVKMFDSVKFKFFRKIMPYSFYDFSNQESKIGIKDYKKLDELLQDESFTQNFYFGNMENFIQALVEPKYINDTKKFINKNNQFQQNNVQIWPIFLNSQQSSVSYAIVPDQIKGKINKQKLQALGIPNKMMGNLMKEGFIIFEEKTIKLEDLVDPTTPSPVILILDIKNEEEFQFFVKSKQVQDIFNDDNKIFSVIIHQTSDEILLHPQYKKYFEEPQFQNTSHVFAGTDDIFYDSSLKNQKDIDVAHSAPEHFYLNNIFNDNFPQFFEKLDLSKQSQVNQQKFKIDKKQDIQEFLTLQNQKSQLIYLARKNFEFNVVPQKSFGYSQMQKKEKTLELNYKMFEEEMKKQNLLNYKELHKEQPQFENKDIDPEITVLGTCCMKPSITRNVSGYLIEHQHFNILLDAGDGTYNQLLNHFGEQKLYESVLERIQVVFISHYHSDHYLGFQQILAKRNAILEEKNIKDRPMYLLIPKVAGPWVQGLEQYFEDKMNVIVVFLQQLENIPSQEQLQKIEQIQSEVDQQQELQKQEQQQLENKDNQDQKQQIEEQKNQEQNVDDQEEEDETDYVHPVQAKLQKLVLDTHFGNQEKNYSDFIQFLKNSNLVEYIQAVPVIHCQQSYGIVIKYNNNYLNKISYSGDTKPCEEFIDKASGSTLMIHEATFSDDFKDAHCRSHTTLTQAVTVGYTSLTENLLLSHFSQRYKKIDLMKFAESYDKQFLDYLTNNTAMAFDHLHFRMSEFQQLPQITRTAMHLMPLEKE